MPERTSKEQRTLRKEVFVAARTPALENETPLEYVLRVMRDVTASPRRRDAAARAALRHLPAAPVAGKPQDAQPPLSRTEIARRVAALLAGASGDKPKTD